MTVKELLEMYDNWNGITVINGDNLKMIIKGRTLDIAENEDIQDREVISFGFVDGEFCIRIAATVYETVMQMSEDDFAKFCFDLYCKGWADGEHNVDDGGWIRCNIANYPMKMWQGGK